MANFTTADVKRLRELTGAGMMDCKRALEESDGDFERAVEILRVKGAKDVGKRAERVAANGLVSVCGTAMIQLNCETDFVAKNEQVQELAAKVAESVESARPTDVVEALDLGLDDGQSVRSAIESVSAVIGEKLELARVAVLDAPVATYLHRKDPALPPQVGVLVSYRGDSPAAARAAAMQVAAMRPRFLTRADVPAEIVDTERRIAQERAREEGKPEAALPKIVDGRVGAFFRDVVLLEQDSVQEHKRTVEQVLADAGVTITGFARFEVGTA